MHQQLTEPDRAVLAQLLELTYSKTKIAMLVLVVPTAFWRQPSPQPSPAICAPRSPMFFARERGPNIFLFEVTRGRTSTFNPGLWEPNAFSVAGPRAIASFRDAAAERATKMG